MKAVYYRRFGGSEVLEYGEIDRPIPGAGQVLVRVAGTSFNPVDLAFRSGVVQGVFPIDFPHVPGVDVAGTIAELGEGVDGWRVGDSVVAFLPMNADGAAAEYALAPVDVLAVAPRTVESADAAALPTVGLTARQALFEHAELKAGQTVLVNGAGGAVGGYAVQLAKQAGAVVTATGSARSVERLRGHGVDRIVEYVDHGATPVVVPGQPFDLVLNLVDTSADENANLVGLASDGGMVVSTMTPAVEDPGRGVRTSGVFVRNDAAQLADLVARVDAGELRIDVAERRPLADLAAVHDAAAAGSLAGKTVLVPA